MSPVEKGIETRVELDYGLRYLREVFGEDMFSRELVLAYTKAEESRMSIGRYVNYLGSPNPYPQMGNPESIVVETPVDLSYDEIDVDKDQHPLKHVKYVIGGFQLGLENLAKLRMVAYPKGVSPADITLAVGSLSRAIDALELSICWLRQESVRLQKENPDKYPAKQEIFGADISSAPEDVPTTEAIMEARVLEGKDPGQPFPAVPEETKTE